MLRCHEILKNEPRRCSTFPSPLVSSLPHLMSALAVGRGVGLRLLCCLICLLFVALALLFAVVMEGWAYLSIRTVYSLSLI